jgi:hypothetical protein
MKGIISITLLVFSREFFPLEHFMISDAGIIFLFATHYVRTNSHQSISPATMLNHRIVTPSIYYPSHQFSHFSNKSIGSASHTSSSIYFCNTHPLKLNKNNGITRSLPSSSNACSSHGIYCVRPF